MALSLLSALALNVAFSMTPMPDDAPVPAPVRAGPGVSLSFAFEPRVGSYGDQDDALNGVGAISVGTPLQLAYGLRGRVFTDSGWIVGGAMTYGFRSTGTPNPGTQPVPTTTSLFDMALVGGHQLGLGFYATVGLGFSALTHTVGSAVDGGALVYLGPALTPRVGYVILGERLGPFVAISAGYSAHFPVGPAHAQPLWEPDFRRGVVHAGLFAVESGFSTGLHRWRWGRR